MEPMASMSDGRVPHPAWSEGTLAWLASQPNGFEPFEPLNWERQGDAGEASSGSSDEGSVATEPFYPEGSEEWGYTAVDFYSSGVGRLFIPDPLPPPPQPLLPTETLLYAGPEPGRRGRLGDLSSRQLPPANQTGCGVPRWAPDAGGLAPFCLLRFHEFTPPTRCDRHLEVASYVQVGPSSRFGSSSQVRGEEWGGHPPGTSAALSGSFWSGTAAEQLEFVIESALKETLKERALRGRSNEVFGERVRGICRRVLSIRDVFDCCVCGRSYPNAPVDRLGLFALDHLVSHPEYYPRRMNTWRRDGTRAQVGGAVCWPMTLVHWVLL